MRAVAPYASDPLRSRGRRYAIATGETRGPRDAFQRDRDRIIHSIPFRRLRHKTQVFVAPDGDHFRVRLTHSLEVAQIGRTIARDLGLNEDLTEALCLAHDIGHPPFGHAGEDVLQEAMAEAERLGALTVPGGEGQVERIPPGPESPGLDRELTIYLPPSYGASDRRYPVLYMHDGQNLFDRALKFREEHTRTIDSLDEFKAMVQSTIKQSWKSDLMREYCPDPAYACYPYDNSQGFGVYSTTLNSKDGAWKTGRGIRKASATT